MAGLDPEIVTWLTWYNDRVGELVKEGFVATPTNVREGLANLTASMVTSEVKVEWIGDAMVKGDGFDVPVRIYHPKPDKPLPVLLYFHGGGHMAGSITVYDPICRRLAERVKHVVVSVEYRLAPECPYPAAIDDGVKAVRLIFETLRGRGVLHREELVLGGDSAGGALCATVSQDLGNGGPSPVAKQVLIYPSLDYTMSLPSIEQNGRGYLLEMEKMRWYFDHYFSQNENRRECSPLFREITVSQIETMVITAEFCPLRDEGLAYIEKLTGVGMQCQHLHFDDMIHAFMNLESIASRQCERLYDAIASFLQR